MDIQQIIDQVIVAGHEAPERLAGLADDPAGTIEGIVGQLPEGIDVGQVISGVEDRLGAVDLSGIQERIGSFDVSGITDAIGGFDPAALAENLPAGVGDLVSSAAEGGLGEAVSSFLGGLFGKR